MIHQKNKQEPTLDTQARLMLLGGLFAAGLAAPAPAPAETLTVSRGGSGSGVVTSAPSGIDCGLDCTESYTLNSTVNLTATATSGSVFDGWSGACSGTINPCTILMSVDQTVTANFSQQISPTVTILSPASNSSAVAGIPITFTGSTSFPPSGVYNGIPYQSFEYHWRIYYGGGQEVDFRGNSRSLAIPATGPATVTLELTLAGHPGPYPSTTIQINVLSEPLTASSSFLSIQGQQDKTVTESLSISGGTAPYRIFADKGTVTVSNSSTRGGTLEYSYVIPADAVVGSVIDDFIRVSDSNPERPEQLVIPVTITVQADSLSAVITHSCAGQQGESIPLTGQASGGAKPYTFTWSAPDGTVTNQTTAGDNTQADVTFNKAGSFRVKLSVVDSSSPRQSADNTINCAISIDPLQVASFAKAPDGKDSYNTGDSIRFTVSATRGVSPYVYRWETSRDGASWTLFGETTEPNSPPYTFSEEGVYGFRVTVNDSTKPTPQTQTSSALSFEVKQQPQDGALDPVQAPASAGPNQTVTLSVRFTEGQQPRPNTTVGWTVTTTDGQPLPTTVTGRLRAAQTQTGADGVATNQFDTGGQQFNYRIAATVNTQSGPKTATFTLAVGLASIVENPTTPEGAMALYVDRACANLYQNGAPNQAAQQLLFRCGQLMQITNPNDARYVMNQLTPRNNPEAANLGKNFSSRQLGNVLSRLAALRHGATGVSLSGLSINQNGQSLSASALAKAFTQQKGGAAGDEPGADLGGRLGIFVNGAISRGDKSRTTQESGFEYDAYDITAGMDYRFTDRFIAGFALGYSSTSSDLNDSGGNLDGSGYTLAGYANYFFGDNLFLDGVVQYGRGSFDMKRNIDYIIPGITEEFFIASASPDARQWGASIGGGYDFKLDQEGLQATLSGHLNYLKATLDSYDENGAEAFNLHVQENTLKSLTFSLSGEISRTFSMSWGILTPRLRIDWLHEFEDNSVPIGGWLLADPIGGTNAFTYQSDKQDSNYFLLGVGASAVFSSGVQAFLFYQATLSKEDYTDNQITAGLRFEF